MQSIDHVISRSNEPMMIGIHDLPGSYSDRWISYCTDNGIPFRRINCLAADIVPQCEELDGLLWHWPHDDPAHLLVARQVIAALEAKGLVVFPNVATCWHFDDKVAQKYLLEAIGAPLIPTWVFTSKVDAVRWIEGATWPKVFKLRCGAGSTNVRLVRSKSQAEALCRQAFGRGLPAVAGYLTDMRTRLRKTKTAHEFWGRLARVPRTLLNLLAVRRRMHREKGYVYFQEFLPGNTFDTRITIIGARAFGFMRANRPDDFRASGSGSIIYEPTKIDKRCVEIAFRVADRIGTQSLAFDFLFNSQDEGMICEISYCYMPSAVHACEGHWDQQGVWHEGHVWPEDAILEDLLTACREKAYTGDGGRFSSNREI
jgi:glutathione synthase/RimK-type ligase-like ATP-grasp enzyme